jgi:hypothetical protein
MISRDDLYTLVWAEPMTKVAARFGVSGSYMARVCDLLNVPRPARGYWAKLTVGKAPKPEPLPDARPGDQLHWSRDGEPLPHPVQRLTVPRRRAARIKVPANHVHTLIKGAKPLFERSRPVDDGAYLRPWKRNLVDVVASQACLDKALGFANDLFNALESAGHRVVLAPSDEPLRRANIEEREAPTERRDPYGYSGRWAPTRPTLVYVGTVAIGLRVLETSEAVVLRYVKGRYIRDADYAPPRRARAFVDHTWTTTRDLPSGRLRLVAYSPHNGVEWSSIWNETKGQTLTADLKPIVKAIEDAPSRLVPMIEEAERKAEARHREWLASIERSKKEDDRRRVAESVQASREALGKIIRHWSNALEVEHFLQQVAERTKTLPNTERDEVQKRLDLARAFLGSQDPLKFLLAWKTPEERYKPVYPEHRSVLDPRPEKAGRQ